MVLSLVTSAGGQAGAAAPRRCGGYACALFLQQPQSKQEREAFPHHRSFIISQHLEKERKRRIDRASMSFLR